MKITNTLAFGVVGLALLGAGIPALAVVPTPSFTLSNPAAPVPGTAGTGLLGQYYGTVANNETSSIDSTGDAMTYINGHSPLASFNASQINYPKTLPFLTAVDALTTFGSFLGTDAASLSDSGMAANKLAGQVIDFKGYLAVKQAGTYKIGIGSDDGSRLMLGGQTIVDNTGTHLYNVMQDNVQFMQPGLYPIEVAYYEKKGLAGVALYSNMTNDFAVPKSLLYAPSAVPSAVPEPGSVALLFGAGISGGLLLRKRRRIA